MELNNFEYGAMKKMEGAIKKRRNLLLAIYIVYTAVFFTIIFSTKMIPLGALYAVSMYILYLATWRYVQVDYKYHIEAGTFTLTRKYGNSKAVKVAELKLKEAVLIAPINRPDDVASVADKSVDKAPILPPEKANEKIRDFEPEIIYDARPSEDTKDAYVILYKDADGKRCAIYIEVAQASLKALHYYNSSVEIIPTEK